MQAKSTSSSVNPVGSVVSVISASDAKVISSIGSKKVIVDHELDPDEAVIMALGYKNEFKREFSLFTTFGVSFSVLGLLPSIASTLWYSICYAGNAGITWGFLVGMIGVVAVALSMAEIASAFPTSGGLYYSTAQLSPPKYKAILSWTVGWSNYFVQVTGAPSVAYGCSAMILALKQMIDETYLYQDWHCFLMTSALTFACAIIASAPTKWIAWINSASAIINMIFIFITWIVVLVANERENLGFPKFNSNSDAWKISNYTEWPDGISILMTFMAVIWTMAGYDSPFHLAEECANAQTAIPNAIVLTATVGGVIAFVFQLAMAYTILDMDAVVNDDLGQPYVSYLNQILDRPKTLALSSMAIITAFAMAFSCMIAASRVLFSYSRDGCFPLSNYWCHVNTVTKTPVNAVWANWFIGELLLLLMFGGVAIDAIFSLGAIGAFISFTIPTLLRITYSRKRFIPGPWNLGRFSMISGITAVSFVALMIPILNFPQYKGADNTPDLMNWTVLVYYGAMLLAIGWYLVYAHKFFKGPKTNLDKDKLIDESDENQVIDAIVSRGSEVRFGLNCSSDEKEKA